MGCVLGSRLPDWLNEWSVAMPRTENEWLCDVPEAIGHGVVATKSGYFLPQGVVTTKSCYHKRELPPKEW